MRASARMSLPLHALHSRAEPLGRGMLLRGLASAASSALLGVCCSCGNPAANAAPPEALPALHVTHGTLAAERLQGDVTLEQIPLGSVQIQICPELGPGQFGMQSQIVPAALLRLVGRLGGRLHSVLSSGDRVPIETQVDVFAGEKTRSYRLQFRPGGFDYYYRRSALAEPERGTRQLPEPEPVNDMHSALLLLRAWRPRLGEVAHLFVAIGRDLWRVEVRFRGPEMLDVQGAPALTRRIDGDARRIGAQAGSSDKGDTQRSFSLWLGEGPEALPVRLQASANYGDVSMSLTRHDRSTEGCAPQALAR